jgi:hypothetical protein
VLHRGPLLIGLRTAWDQRRNLGSPLEPAFHLLLNGYVEDVSKLMVHLIDPIGGGHGQSVQEHHGHDHVLAGPGKGWTQHPFMVDGEGDGPSQSSSFGEVDGGGSLHPQRCLVSM